VKILNRRIKKPSSRRKIEPPSGSSSDHVSETSRDIPQNIPEAPSPDEEAIAVASVEVLVESTYPSRGDDRALANDDNSVEIAGLPDGVRVDQQSLESNLAHSVDTIRNELIPADIFDEAEYLRLNADVRQAIEVGQIESGYAHYLLHGNAEGRPLPDAPREVRNTILISPVGGKLAHASTKDVRCSIDALIIAPNAGLMVVGWIDDISHPISCIRIIASDWRVVIDVSRLIRVRRTDVETAIGSRGPHAFGFFGFLHFDQGGHASGPIKIELWRKGGFSSALQFAPAFVDDVELRNCALAHLASASFFGNADVESVARLGQGVGSELVRFNKAITGRIVATPYFERFGPQRSFARGTIVVCLYGKPEFYFLQSCLFAAQPGIENYEFVYVSNSPEMAETLLREAHSASLMYGLSSTIMILPGNAGFGAANNAASRIARSSRLLVVNPDVFPRDLDWAKKHTELLDAAPPPQTRLFGVPLYYDDGSIMHGGMYFEIDIALSMSDGKPAPKRMCRTQHYGKGAPTESPQFTRPRPVPAVTGAFMSIDRSWFEHLGGFTEDFIFGHYEDADLCLKSIQRGTAPWLQDIRLWHLEGKGSTRQLPHEGGSIVNRWLFSQTWMPVIEAGLNGPSPHHPLLQDTTPTLSSITEADQSKTKSANRERVFR
jgi:GT2 family glycosyltransferase